MSALGRGPRAELRIDVGPAVPAWALRLVALAAGTGAVLAAVSTSAGWVVGIVLVVGAVLRPRGVWPAALLGAIGVDLLLQPERGLAWFAVSCALTVLCVHLCLTALRLTENLDLGSPVAVAVLRARWPVFWRAQLLGQLLGCVAWAVPALASAWFTVPAVLGVGFLGWLLLGPDGPWGPPAPTTPGA